MTSTITDNEMKSHGMQTTHPLDGHQGSSWCPPSEPVSWYLGSKQEFIWCMWGGGSGDWGREQDCQR